MSKERKFTALALVFAFIQPLVPTFQLSESLSAITTTVVVTLVSIFTILKQRESVEISKNAQVATYILVAIAALGGLNEVIGAIHFDPITETRLRTGVTALIGILNITSKNLFPTDEGKVIEQTKKDLKTFQKFKQ